MHHQLNDCVASYQNHKTITPPYFLTDSHLPYAPLVVAVVVVAGWSQNLQDMTHAKLLDSRDM